MTELSALMDAFFDAVSFDSGSPRYERLHELFIEDGKLIKNTTEVPEISSVDEFIAPRRELVATGKLASFREHETAEITEVFGQVAHRFSTYSKTGVLAGEPFEGRGVISTQFVKTPDGWRIASLAWDDERPGLALPERYAP